MAGTLGFSCHVSEACQIELGDDALELMTDADVTALSWYRRTVMAKGQRRHPRDASFAWTSSPAVCITCTTMVAAAVGSFIFAGWAALFQVVIRKAKNVGKNSSFDCFRLQRQPVMGGAEGAQLHPMHMTSLAQMQPGTVAAGLDTGQAGCFILAGSAPMLAEQVQAHGASASHTILHVEPMQAEPSTTSISLELQTTEEPKASGFCAIGCKPRVCARIRCCH